MRKVGSCMNCGEVREIVAAGFCSKCDMRRHRQMDRARDPDLLLTGPDRSQNRRHRELNAYRVTFAKILKMIDELPVTELIVPSEELNYFKNKLLGYIHRIGLMQSTVALPAKLEPELETGGESTVNSNSELTVNCDEEPGDVPLPTPIKTEPELSYVIASPQLDEDERG